MLLLGSTSIVGYNLGRLYPSEIRPVVTSRTRTNVPNQDRLLLDDAATIGQFVDAAGSNVVIYCDAVCDVQKCELNPEWATEINVNNLRRTLSVLSSHCRLVYISSDHVFGGDGRYDEHSSCCPISHYGRTRTAAEVLALARPGTLVIRPGLPVGPSPDGRTGHMDWLRYRMLRGLPVTIIEDEARSAVHTDDLCLRIVQLARSPLTGIRHITATHPVFRPELAYLLAGYMDIPMNFGIRKRRDQPYPHLGMVELATCYDDSLAAALPSAMDKFGGEDEELPLLDALAVELP